MGGLRTRYQDRVARLQRGTKAGDCRRRIVSVEIWIKGWKRIDVAINGPFHSRVSSEALDSADERALEDAGRRSPAIARMRTGAWVSTEM
jgi:hypothetical protein